MVPEQKVKGNPKRGAPDETQDHSPIESQTGGISLEHITTHIYCRDVLSEQKI